MSASITNSEKILVPALRFREFDGEWNTKKLGDIYKINASGDIDVNHVSQIKTEKYQYPIYANARKGKGFYAYSDIYKVEPNTVTIAGRGAHLGIAHARDHKFYPIVRLLVLKPLNEEDIHFSECAINRINLFIESTGVPQLTAPQISGYAISLPSLPEQQKIASFLSAVDDKVQQLTKKAALLEDYKKGVMQQLFSGQLRFKAEDGKDYPDWEERLLGEVCESIKSGKSKSSEDGVVPLYGSTGIIGKCSESSHQGEFILIARVGANAGAINLIDDNFGVSDNTLVVVCTPILEIGYIYYFLDHYNLNRLIFGSGQPLITGGLLKALKLKLPIIKEQQKIATYLSGIDIQIESVNTQITQTQTFKKGLLQQMFV